MSYSSRVIRKLKGRDDIIFSTPTLSDQDSESEDESQSINKNTVNKFLLLNDSGSDQKISSNEDADDDDTTTDTVKNFEGNTNSDFKRKKRKRKKKGRHGPFNSVKSVSHGNDMEVIADIPSVSKPHKKATVQTKSVLTVEHKHLNPDNELKKIFGARVLMADASYRKRAKGSSHKGVWLTQPQDNWVKVGRLGLSMDLVKTEQNYQIFKYTHNKEYQNIQFKFFDAVDSSDHRNIASVLENHSYHVDSLLTFSDVYKLHDDLKMARELIERCLYCLECSFHPSFNITTGKSRLPYKYQENRCLFLALFKHMNFVSQRGCNRTALELCKVLLNLDPDEDPLCSVFSLDCFALRSAQYEFLIEYAEEAGNKRNLSQLPNWAYSLALAQFHLSRSAEGSTEKADEGLRNALIMFPSVLFPLLEKCSVQPDQAVTNHAFFTKQATQSSPQGLVLLTHLFVERNYLFWKDPDVLGWLESNVKVVIEKLDEKSSYVSECAKKRKTRYSKPPLNVYRYALMSELPGVSELLPLEIRTGTLLSHDPLPPPNGVRSYERPARSSSSRRHPNPISLFFQSILPDYNPDDPLAFVNVPEDEEANHAGEMRGNVRMLMDAMRELFNSFHQPVNESDVEDFVQDWD